MRSFGFRLTLLVAILWAGIGSTVWALGHHRETVETVYVMPSPVSLPVPTSYVVSTSWVEPTAYAVPTYYATAYWIDPVVVAQPTYAETAYVRRGGLFGRRRVVERPVLATYATSYVPTTYYASAPAYRATSYYAAAPAYRATSYVLADPLVVPTAYLASADCVCPPAVASAAPTYAPPSRGTGETGTGTGARSRSLRSEAEDRGSMSSNVEPPPPENLDQVGSGRATGGANTNPAESTPNTLPDIPTRVRDTSPPPPPAPAASRPAAVAPGGVNPQGGTPGTTPGTGRAGQSGGPAAKTQAQTNPNATGGSTPAGNPGAGPGNPGAGSNPGAVAPPTAPAAPADDLGAPPPIGPSGEGRRESLKPSSYAMRPVPAEFRNVLMGTVNSGSAGAPEEDVRISVRNIRTGTSKSTTTNAFGRFAVRLTDGDWAVDVTMPSGRVYEVSRLRVDDGLIVDNLGRRVPTLDITR